MPAVTTITESEFWGLFRDCVEQWSQDLPRNKQVNTWALINTPGDLSAPNLGMTAVQRDNARFFSRRWAESGYNPNDIPVSYGLLAAMYVDVQIERVSNTAFQKTVRFDLGVFDQYLSSTQQVPEHEHRLPAEIFDDTANMLTGVFRYLMNVARVRLDGEAEYRWMHKLKAVLTPGSHTYDEAATRQFTRSFSATQQNVISIPWRGGADNLYGSYASNLEFSFACRDDAEFDYAKDYTRKVNERVETNT